MSDVPPPPEEAAAEAATAAPVLVPLWLEPLLKTTFFYACTEHPVSPRNEQNMFCTDCSDSSSAFCIYCRSQRHSGHRVLQIRRSSYHNVVRLAEIEDLLDVGGVQTYVINSAKVFFLNERPQPRGPGAAAGKAAATPYFCEVCSRSLLDHFRFCSLGCKLVRVKEVGDVSFVLGGGGGEAEASGSGRAEGEIAGSSPENADDGEPPAGTPAKQKNASQARRRKGIPHRSVIAS